MHCRGLQGFKTAEGKVEKLRVGHYSAFEVASEAPCRGYSLSGANFSYRSSFGMSAFVGRSLSIHKHKHLPRSGVSHNN